MKTNDFKNAWNGLSPIQKEAALWDEGSLLVIAGPGSGKTRVLTCRIAYLIEKTENERFRILGLTFTNKAADEMRNRVNTFIPGNEDRIFLCTFHSFCADVLRQHGVHLGINPNFSIYSQESDLQAVVDEAVQDAADKFDYVTDNERKALPVIQRLKTSLIFPEEAEKTFSDISLGRRFAAVYAAYENQLSKRNALDFNSLLVYTYKLFRKYPALAKRYRTVYKYICIDEFQDTTEAQYKIIKALAGNEFHNIFVVADDDQIIYQWNGASYKRIEQFTQEFSPKIIQLPLNYRCPPEIVSIANNLIRYNFQRSKNKQPIQAFRLSNGGNNVRLLSGFPNEDAEAEEIVKDIMSNHIKEYGTVVVLARNRKLLLTIQRSFDAHSISAIIAQRKDSFESTPLIWIQSVLFLANDRQDQKQLITLCGSFEKLTNLVISSDEVISQADLSNHDLLQHWTNIAIQKISDGKMKTVLHSINKNLVNSRDFLAFCKDAFDWVEKESQQGFDQYSKTFAHYEEEKDVWDELVRDIKGSLRENLTLDAFLQEIQMRSKEATPKKDVVLLMTIHGAKGKEFKHVYLIGMVEDELPSFQSKQKGADSPEMEEERRNCFVAITRALETLTLSYADSYRGWPKNPSRFLCEMGILVESKTENDEELPF